MTTSESAVKPVKDLCKKCGRCCCFKSQLPDGIKVFTPLHCVHLDRATRLCKVYAERKQINPGCMGWRQAMEGSFLPDSCAYVERYGWQGYRCKAVEMPWAWWREHQEWLRALALRFGYSPREYEALLADCEAGRWG